jgi:hypothetical protein
MTYTQCNCSNFSKSDISLDGLLSFQDTLPLSSNMISVLECLDDKTSSSFIDKTSDFCKAIVVCGIDVCAIAAYKLTQQRAGRRGNTSSISLLILRLAYKGHKNCRRRCCCNIFPLMAPKWHDILASDRNKKSSSAFDVLFKAGLYVN